jgi:histidyl-tRNA synthetase
VDAEHIVMCAALWRELDLGNIRLELNNIGSPEERARYRADLVEHLEKHRDRLDADALRRMHTNPLRTLDSKNPLVQEVVAGAPSLSDYLGDASRAHFDGLKRLLAVSRIEYSINPRLVRGLDYYNLTVFEWISPDLGAQGTVCGGGRYDGLFAQIGGKPAPATGFAMGNERLIALLRDAGRKPAPQPPHAYVVYQGDGTLDYAFAVSEELRSRGLKVLMHAGGGGFKSQMKRADSSGAQYAVIIGEDELKAGEVSVKPLRADQPQTRVKRDLVAAMLKGN